MILLDEGKGREYDKSYMAGTGDDRRRQIS